MVGPISGSQSRISWIIGAALAIVMIACASTETPEGPVPSEGRSAARGEQQTLGDVAVESEDEETIIILEGLFQPSFSSSSEDDTLVIELPGVKQGSKSLFAALSDASQEVEVGDGRVERVRAETLVEDDWPVTTVSVTFAGAAEHEVVTTRDGLTVFVRSGVAAEEVASDYPASDEGIAPYASGGMAAPEDGSDAYADEYASEYGAEEPAERYEESYSAEGYDQSHAATGHEVASETSVADPWATASPADDEPMAGEVEGAAEAEPVPVAVAEPATMLHALNLEEASSGLLLHLQANGAITSAESFVIENPDRLVLDLHGLENEMPQSAVQIDTDQVARVRIGTHPDKVRVVLDGGPGSNAFVGRRVITANDGLYVTVGEGPDLDEALAAGLSLSNGSANLAATEDWEQPAPATAAPRPDGAPSIEEPMEVAETAPASSWDAEPIEPASTPSAFESAPTPSSWDASGDAASAEIYGLQYDRNSDRDRVAVLSNRTIAYELMTPDEETVVIAIRDAVIEDAAGERITPELGGPISLVTTFQQPEVPGNEVRVVIKRGMGIQPRLTNRGSLLFVDFPNTGVAAAPPPAFIPGETRAQPGERMASGLTVTADVPMDEAYPSDEQVSGEAVADPMAPPSEPSPEMADETMPMAEDVPAAVAETESYEDLPQFDDAPVAPEPVDPGQEWLASAPTQAEEPAPPGSLAAPAAVDILEEGGLIDGKEYTGRRISLDFKDVEIADVLRLIADVSDLNIIAGDEVAGNITIRLVDVPWDQALDVILLTKGLGFIRVGSVLRIAPQEILKVEQEIRLQERRNAEKLEDLEVKLQPVNYASVKDTQKLVKRLLSPRGTVNMDERTNTLIIKDISSVIDEATALVQAVDTQTPQVMIEAKIVEANLEFARELGSVWAVGTQQWQDGFNPGTNPRTDLPGGDNFRFQGENSVVFSNPITAVPTGLVNFGAFLLDDKMRVDVQIQAMEATGDGKVISSPRVVTLDNREALIEQGVSIPFQTFEGGDAKLEFIDAVLSLKVTPHITTDQSIIMTLEVTRNAPDASVSTPTGSPAIAKNQAKTETLVKDGQTLVIGGIYTVDKTLRDTRVPYLHRIPVLGAAFKSKEVSDVRKELLIFVTPRVVVNPALASN